MGRTAQDSQLAAVPRSGVRPFWGRFKTLESCYFSISFGWPGVLDSACCVVACLRIRSLTSFRRASIPAVMTDGNPSFFFSTCPSCDALFHVVKAGAIGKSARYRTACHMCGAALPMREGKFFLRYFPLRKPPLRRRASSWRIGRRRSLPTKQPVVI